MYKVKEELTAEQRQHLTELLFRRLTDNESFRSGVAIGLAGKFTLKQYEGYIQDIANRVLPRVLS